MLSVNIVSHSAAVFTSVEISESALPTHACVWRCHRNLAVWTNTRWKRGEKKHCKNKLSKLSAATKFFILKKKSYILAHFILEQCYCDKLKLAKSVLSNSNKKRNRKLLCRMSVTKCLPVILLCFAAEKKYLPAPNMAFCFFGGKYSWMWLLDVCVFVCVQCSEGFPFGMLMTD